MARGERDPFSLRRIPSVWTSFWRRPSNTAAPRGLPPAVDQRMITTRRSAGRSEKRQARVHAAAKVLGLRIYSRLFVCQGFFVGIIRGFFFPPCVKRYERDEYMNAFCSKCHFRCCQRYLMTPAVLSYFESVYRVKTAEPVDIYIYPIFPGLYS